MLSRLNTNKRKRKSLRIIERNTSKTWKDGNIIEMNVKIK